MSQDRDMRVTEHGAFGDAAGNTRPRAPRTPLPPIALFTVTPAPSHRAPGLLGCAAASKVGRARARRAGKMREQRLAAGSASSSTRRCAFESPRPTVAQAAVGERSRRSGRRRQVKLSWRACSSRRPRTRAARGGGPECHHYRQSGGPQLAPRRDVYQSYGVTNQELINRAALSHQPGPALAGEHKDPRNEVLTSAKRAEERKHTKYDATLKSQQEPVPTRGK
jgi:hypothetical protein